MLVLTLLQGGILNAYHRCNMQNSEAKRHSWRKIVLLLHQLKISERVRMNKLILSLIAISGALTIVGCANAKKEPDSLRLGAIVFLTGPQANLGVEVKNALQIAQDELNTTGGIRGKKLEILLEDSHDNPKDAIMSFNKLLSEKVPLIISTGDVVSLKLAPLADEQHIPVIATVAAGPDVGTNDGCVFRVFIQAIKQGETMGKYATDSLKLSKASILSINNEFGVASSGSFRKAFERAGAIVRQETYEIGDRDIRTPITKVLAEKPQAIYVTGFGPGYCTAIKQVRELGYKGILLTDCSLSVPWVKEQVGSAAQDAYFTDGAFNESNPRTLKFSKAYEHKFNSKPSFVAAFAYDSLKIAAESLEKGDGSADSLVLALSSISKFDGLSGQLSFDGKRDIVIPLKVSKFKVCEKEAISHR
jgi:branched-chain amino acid transport system substrate-binding protein